MRLFVAVALPGTVRKELARVAEALAPANPGVRWVPEENHHLTLSFLGGVADERVEDIVAALRRSVSDVEAGSARLDGVGAFPTAERARVLWVGLADDGGVVARVSEAVSGTLDALGFAREDRPFTPHVTIGRRKEGSPLRPASAVPVAPLEVPVDQVTLFRSHLGRPAPRYEIIEAFPLGG